MASNIFVQYYANGDKKTVRRSTKQGRRPSGLGRLKSVRLYQDSIEKMDKLKEIYGCYWNENDFIRSAVAEKLSNSVYTELTIH